MNTQATLLFRYKRLLTSDFGSSIRGERHNSYYADCTIWPHKCAAHPIVFKVSVGRDLQNSKVRLQLLNIMSRTQILNCLPLRQITPVSVYMAQSQPSNWLFFKIFKFSGPSLPGMTSFTHQTYFLSEVYYVNCDYQILCAWAQNCTHSYAPELRAQLFKAKPNWMIKYN